MAGRPDRAPGRGEGAHAPERRARPETAGAAVGRGREGLRFETDDGIKTLADLFDGRSQLLVYHFMFGPTADDAGCPGCSSTADSLDGAVVHLPPRGVTFVAVSRAPLENLQAYKRRMGWSFPWVSARRSDFNLDFAVFTEEERRTARLQLRDAEARGRDRRQARRAPRPERLCARRRHRLPHLLVLRPRHGCPEHDLATTRPHSRKARRQPPGLATPTRRIHR